MNERLKGFDGLRAFLIISIVMYHLLPEAFPGGFIGVNGFFLIMGFLMEYGMKEKRFAVGARQKAIENESTETLISPISYYLKKIRRLYPALIVTLTLGLIVLLIFVHNYRNETFQEIISVLGGMNNYYQINTNASYFTRMLNSSPFTHLWYIGLTIQFYFVWPIYSIIIEKRKLKHVMFAEIVLILASFLEMAYLYAPKKDPSRIYYGFDTRVYALLLGILLCQVYFSILKSENERVRELKVNLGVRNWKKTASAIVVTVLSCACLIKLIFMLEGGMKETYRGGMQLSTLLYGLILISILFDQKGIARWWDFFPLRVIGKYSYEIYLVMYPCIWFSEKLLHGTRGKKYLIITIASMVIATAIVHVLSAKIMSKHRDLNILVNEDTPNLRRVVSRSLVPTLLLASVLIVSSAQTLYAKSLGGTDDMKEMQALMEENSEILNQQQKFTLKLEKSLSKVNAHVELQTEIVEKNAGLRAEQRAQEEAEKQAALERAKNAQTEIQKVQAELPDAGSSSVSGVSALGDSVMLGAAQEMMERMPGIYVDAKVGRQVSQGAGVINGMRSSGLLGSVVIVHLGTNGAGSVSSYLNVIDSIGPDSTIYWLTAHGVSWGGQVNANIYEAASQRPNVHVLDWDAYSSGHGEWFFSDGIHLNGAGRAAYANFVKSSIGM